jgi:hypothetical protein
MISSLLVELSRLGLARLETKLVMNLGNSPEVRSA